jgi:hypothetical protein
MKLLFALIGLLGFSLSATAEKGWLFYDNYPWVYDNITKDWLYLKAHTNGKLYAYRHSTSLWEEFSAHKHDDAIPVPTWDDQYQEWIQNPEPYGGLAVLQQIKDAKDNDRASLNLYNDNISDVSPLAGLTDLTELELQGNNISDLTPLAGLTNLTELHLGWNPSITDLTPLAGLTNLTYLSLGLSNITDLTPLAGLTNLTELYLNDCDNISDITPLAVLTNLTRLNLGGNNISDITPLAGLTNLTWLGIFRNNITDITPLAGLTNLTELLLSYNNISDSQKAMLEEALPSTQFSW